MNKYIFAATLIFYMALVIMNNALSCTNDGMYNIEFGQRINDVPNIEKIGVPYHGTQTYQLPIEFDEIFPFEKLHVGVTHQGMVYLINVNLSGDADELANIYDQVKNSIFKVNPSIKWIVSDRHEAEGLLIGMNDDVKVTLINTDRVLIYECRSLKMGPNENALYDPISLHYLRK